MPWRPPTQQVWRQPQHTIVPAGQRVHIADRLAIHILDGSPANAATCVPQGRPSTSDSVAMTSPAAGLSCAGGAICAPLDAAAFDELDLQNFLMIGVCFPVSLTSGLILEGAWALPGKRRHVGLPASRKRRAAK